MPKLLRNRPSMPFREDIYGKVVGVEAFRISRLSNGYREKCYGGDELQFRVRTARPISSSLGDSYANAVLRKMGADGAKGHVCPTCHIESSVMGRCFC